MTAYFFYLYNSLFVAVTLYSCFGRHFNISGNRGNVVLPSSLYIGQQCPIYTNAQYTIAKVSAMQDHCINLLCK